MTSSQRRMSRALLCATCSVLPFALFAQDIDLSDVGTIEAPEGFALDTIIIGGELQTRSLQETPTSVGVITGAEVEGSGSPSIVSDINRIPNVVAVNNNQGFAIRGIDQRGLGGGGAGLTVSTQVDGIALPGNQATFYGPYSTWDLEQVEVLRGPQSTQQGRNALAGAVVIRSKDPTYEDEIKTQVEVGSRDTLGAALAINQTLIEDRLALRFSADHFQTDGWVENPTRDEDDYDGVERTTYRAKLRWDPTDTVSTVFSYIRSENFAGQDIIDKASFPDDRFNFSDAPSEEGSVQEIFGARVSWEINDIWTLDSETTYFDSDYTRTEDFDGTALPLATFDRDGESTAFEQDLTLTFDLSTARGVLGLFYTKLDFDNPTISQGDASGFLPGLVPPGFVNVTRFNDFGSEVENYALYGEVELDVPNSPGLSVTLGARYDREKITNISVEDVTLSPDICDPFPLDPDICAQVPVGNDFSGTESFNAFLPKFGITYDWSQDVSTSFTVQRSYRSGGTGLNAFLGTSYEFDPEYTLTYELAFRGQFYDGRLTTNANLFYTDWKDQQVSILGDSGNTLDTTVVNAGDSRVWGGELYADWQATPDLNVFGSIGYANTRFEDFEADGESLTGNRFPFAPEWTAAFGGAYAFDNGLRVMGDMVFTGQNYSDAENTRNVPSYTVFNAAMEYEWDDYTARLYVRNLFDKDYITSNLTGEVARSGEPRTVGLVLSAAF
ncbi:MAG: TonB-dependent receptor [Pseudomonadota bacterium]